MSKSFVVVALCLIFVAVAFGDISFKFERDYLMQNYPIQLRISTTDENISGLKFWPRLLDDEAKRSPPPALWQISVPASASGAHRQEIADFGVDVVAITDDDFGSTNYFPCTQESTKQTVAYLTYDSDTTQFTINVIGAWSSKWNADKGYGKWDLLCPVWVEPTTVASQSFNIYSSWENDDTAKSANTTLTSKNWRTPHIVFKSLGYAETSADVYSTTNVNIEFTTDTVGVYSVGTINGPRFYEHSLTNGKDSDFYCTSGTDKQYARIQYSEGSVYLFVDKTSSSDKEPIKCTLFLDNSQASNFVRSERTSVKISLANASVARTLPLKYHAAAIGATMDSSGPKFVGFGAATQQEIELSVEAFGGLQFSTTPMNANSTITFAFSKHFDVSNLILPTSQQGYREFTGCHDISATIFVDKGANKIELKDVEQPSNSLYCEFRFDGSKVFAYQKDAKMGSVTVSIDGNTLSAAHAPGNAAPIYFRARFGVQDVIHDEKETGDEITIVDTFTIVDHYSSYAVTPTEPIITLQITGQQNFNYEDYGNQLTCQASTPTDSGLTAFPLTFSASTLTWSSPIKSIVEVESYAIIFKCTRKVKKSFRFGLDITPVSDLSVNVIDLIDGKRYQTIESESIPMTSRTFASERPSGSEVPGANQYHFKMASTVVLPLVDAFAIDDNKKAGETVTAAFKSQLEARLTDTDPAEKVYKDWTFETKNTPAHSINTVSSYNYVDAHIAPKIHTYIYTLLANAWTPFDLSTLSAFGQLVQKSASTLHQNIHYASVSVSQWFIARPKDNDVSIPVRFSASDELYGHFVAKTRGTDHVIDPQEAFSGLPAQSGEAFWATPIKGCGIVDGAQLIGDNDREVNWSEWSNLVAASKEHRLCNVGDSCSVNADCAQATNKYSGAIVCKSSKCTQVPNVLPPYIEYQSVQSMYADKEFFNSASMVSMSFAVVAVIAAFVF